MDNKTAIAQLTSMVGQRQNDIDALNAALTVLETGFQSDTDFIAAKLNDTIATLTAAIPTPAPKPDPTPVPDPVITPDPTPVDPVDPKPVDPVPDPVVDSTDAVTPI